MASLQSLPVEVLVLIFQSLPRSNLWSLCLVCSRFRNPAQACLYARIDLWWDAGKTPAILSLLRTVVHHPELAAHVRELVLDGSRRDFFDALDPADSPTPKLSLLQTSDDDIQVYDSVIPAFVSANHRASWSKEFRNGTMDAYATLLISLLPSLHSITIANSFAKEIGLLGVFLRSLVSSTNQSISQGFLGQLRKAIYLPARSNRITQKKYNPIDVLPIFSLPMIAEIKVWISNPIHFYWPSAAPLNIAALVDLSLVRIREPYLEQILYHTTQLKSFWWEWFYDDEGEPISQVRSIDLDKLCSALAHVKQTLETLTIRVATENGENVDPGTLPEFTIIGSLRPLKSYPNLKSVGSVVGFFLGFDATEKAISMPEVLPPSTKRVTFYSDLDGYDHSGWNRRNTLLMLCDWFQESLHETPRLRNLDVEIGYGVGDCWWQEELDELSDICVRFGLLLDVLTES